MIKYILKTLILGCALIGYSQVPGSWNVNGPSFNYSMTLTARIEYNCVFLNDNQNAIGAFVGNTCRGYAYTTTDALGVKLANVVIFSNQVSGEAVTLKIFDQATGNIYNCLDGFTFVNEAIIGNVNTPFIATTNHRPTDISVNNLNVQEGSPIGAYIGTITGTDQDLGQTLSYALAAGNYDNDNFSVSGNQLNLNTVLNFAIQDSFQIELTVNDGQGCDYSELFWVTVDDSAFAPVANADWFSGNEDDTLNFNLIANDTDYDNDIDSTSITFIDLPSNGTVLANDNGTIDYTPTANWFGLDTLIYQVCDLTNTGALCDTAYLYITVINVPDAPIANNDKDTLDENSSVTTEVLLNDTDIENDINAASVSIVVQPLFGAAIANTNGTITYTPNQNWYGQDTLYYAVCDLTSPTPLCDTAMLTLEVINVPSAAYDIVIDTVSFLEGNPNMFYLSKIRSLDLDPSDTYMYELVPGIGDYNNNQFEIAGDQLFVKYRADFEVKEIYYLRVRSTGVEDGLSFEKAFTIQVIDIEGNSFPLNTSAFISNNLDGKNDYFWIENVELYENFKLKIFDQFGEIVFQTAEKYDNKFDGTVNGEKLPTGAYYYSFENDKKRYTGNLTIMN